MPNIGFLGVQDSGKTLGMVVSVIELLVKGGYEPDEVTSNLHLNIPGVNYMDNDHIRKYIRKVYRESRGKIKHKIIVVDEIDQVYSHLRSMDKEQTEDLLSLWQDIKLFIYFFYTKHLGLGANKLVRDATEIEVIPYLARGADTLYLTYINSLYMTISQRCCEHVSKFYKYYDRWEAII